MLLLLLAQQAAQAQANMDAAVEHAQEQQALPLVVDDDGDGKEEDNSDSPMVNYLSLVNARLMVEMKHGSTCTDMWMRKLLQHNNWWLRAEHAHCACKELGTKDPAERFYYRSVYAWLPDVRWGTDSMPSCPNGCCRSNVCSSRNTSRNRSRNRSRNTATARQVWRLALVASAVCAHGAAHCHFCAWGGGKGCWWRRHVRHCCCGSG